MRERKGLSNAKMLYTPEKSTGVRRERERERKGLYVKSTQIGYIRTSKAWKKEKY